MPEALAAIPTLQLPTGNSSETETTTTDRSTTSATEAPAASSIAMTQESTNSGGGKRKLQQYAGQKKSRKSLGRRTQKKPQLKVNSQQKTAAATAAALNTKSQIPRALFLTPSSSSTSLITNASLSAAVTPSSSSPSPLTTSALPSPAVARPATPRRHLQLQRQNTTTILNFRIRKSISSISQMDLKRSRRGPATYQMAKPLERGAETEQNSKALVPSDCNDVTAILGSSSQSSLVNKILDPNNYYYVLPQERDPRIAGMRIFATIMLNAWRKRRGDVKRLNEEVNDLKRGSIKAKNQLHVFNTLFRVEQKRNDELNCQLKRSLEDINKTKSSCESLTTSLISLKADKELLEQQVQIKEQEFDGINTILTQTKSDLFKSMSQERELQAKLSGEQRKVQMLENQKNELINEICELNTESLQKEESLREELAGKDGALKKAYAEIKLLEDVINDLKDKDYQLQDCMESECKLRNELENLKSEVNTLQQCLAATVGNRLRTCWNNSVAYQKATLQLIHWVAYCTLPATPPPKISHFPFGLTLEKALSIVRR